MRSSKFRSHNFPQFFKWFSLNIIIPHELVFDIFPLISHKKSSHHIYSQNKEKAFWQCETTSLFPQLAKLYWWVELPFNCTFVDFLICFTNWSSTVLLSFNKSLTDILELTRGWFKSSGLSDKKDTTLTHELNDAKDRFSANLSRIVNSRALFFFFFLFYINYRHTSLDKYLPERLRNCPEFSEVISSPAQDCLFNFRITWASIVSLSSSAFDTHLGGTFKSEDFSETQSNQEFARERELMLANSVFEGILNGLVKSSFWNISPSDKVRRWMDLEGIRVLMFTKTFRIFITNIR